MYWISGNRIDFIDPFRSGVYHRAWFPYYDNPCNPVCSRLHIYYSGDSDSGAPRPQADAVRDTDVGIGRNNRGDSQECPCVCGAGIVLDRRNACCDIWKHYKYSASSANSRLCTFCSRDAVPCRTESGCSCMPFCPDTAVPCRSWIRHFLVPANTESFDRSYCLYYNIHADTVVAEEPRPAGA